MIYSKSSNLIKIEIIMGANYKQNVWLHSVIDFQLIYSPYSLYSFTDASMTLFVD